MNLFIALGLSFLSIAAAGCNKTDPEQKAASEPIQQEQPGKSTPTTEAKTTQHGRAALDSYEEIRAALAENDLSTAIAKAKALETKASAAAEAEGSAHTKQWKELARAAKALHSMSKADADTVRRTFGEVSQALIALLKAEPSMAERLHIFECPMAQGYGKWVQKDEKIQNPYMGTKMPACGSKSTI